MFYNFLLILNELQDYEYRHMVQILNKKQKKFSRHVLHLIKTSEPFYCFLSGGARWVNYTSQKHSFKQP